MKLLCFKCNYSNIKLVHVRTSRYDFSVTMPLTNTLLKFLILIHVHGYNPIITVHVHDDL